MEDLEKKVLRTIKENNLIEKGDRIVACVSGGPDSICLLELLVGLKKELEFTVIVAHVNHQIREEAEDDEEYVKKYCEERNIKCYVKKVEVAKIAQEQKRGLEETGRKIRYEFFEEIQKKEDANKIAIAHNRNDKVETVLMNLLRGSGTSGLKGIEIKRKQYIRPLLEIERKEIEEYCEEKKLNPRIDKTNLDNTYTRNRIRNELIPMLRDNFNPNILTAIEKLSKLVAEEQNYFEKIVDTTYQNILLEEQDKRIVLDLKKFNKQDIVIKRRLILYTINRLFGTMQNIEKIHVDDMIILCQRNIGNKYLTPNKNTKIYVKNGKIFLTATM